MSRKPPKGVLIGVVAAAIFIILVIAAIYFEVGGLKGRLHNVNAPVANVSGTISLVNAFAARYNNSIETAAYAKLHYHESNATYSNYTLRVFRKAPLTKIYLLDVDNYCINCFLSSTLEGELRADLGRYGLLPNQSSFNYIQISNVSSVTPGSIIIVPSGLMPLPFLAVQNSSLANYSACSFNHNYSIINMLSSGDTIIYIGRNFSRTVSCGQQIIETPNDTVNILKNDGLLTESVNSVEQAEAAVQSYLAFNAPTFTFVGGSTFYSGTYVNALNGSVVALSDFPSHGWNDSSSLLANDIAALIDLHYWDGLLATGSSGWQTMSNNSGAGTMSLVTNTTQVNSTDTALLASTNVYGLATAYFKSADLKKSAEDNIPFILNTTQYGSVGLPPAVSQTESEYVSATATNISGGFDSFHIYIYNTSYDEPVQYVFVGPMKENITFVKPVSFYLQGGYYTASLVDLHNRTYARAIFRIYNTTIKPVNLDFGNRNFTFSAYSGGYALNGVPYSISLNGGYQENGTVNNSAIRYSLPGGSVVNYGNETFRINVFGKNQTIIAPYQNAVLNIPSYYIEFIIAAVIIVALNKILVPPNIDRYYINVQEFRQTNRAKVKEPADTILKVFDQVNYYYHWRYMPLSADEVKAGISGNVRYGNMPIAVTLQNTYNVLNKLSSKGFVVESEGYFAPKKWIEDSKHDIEYLAVFRMLRDYCVSNAMLFTDIDAYENVDMIVTNKGVQNYIYIYSRLSGNQKLSDIPLSKAYRTFIVFINEVEKLDFIGRLNISYGEESEILRLSIESLDVRLIDTHDFGQLKL